MIGKKLILYILLSCSSSLAVGQIDSIKLPWNKTLLNTAKNETYMTAGEKLMIEEINMVRSNPKKYAALYIQSYLDAAKDQVKKYGKGPKRYSIHTSYNNNNVSKVDTIYHYEYEERLKAIESLMEKLKTMAPASILKPDKGIYIAAQAHAKDQKPTGTLGHVGTDKSWPHERIKKYSPLMTDGNENLVCKDTSARNSLILLLIDDGITGYGHRENILRPYWTHCACLYLGDFDNKQYCKWWIQEFGSKK